MEQWFRAVGASNLAQLHRDDGVRATSCNLGRDHEYCRPTEAADLVRPGMWLDFAAVNSQPEVFDQALAARAHELSDVKVRSCLSVRPLAFVEADPEGRHFHSYNW